MRINWLGTGLFAFVAVSLGIALLPGCDGNGSGRPPERSDPNLAGEGAEPRLEWAPPVEIAVGEAYQGPWRMNESDFRYVDAPTVARSNAGLVAVAWVDQAERDVFVQLFGQDGDARLEAPVNVSRSPRVFSWLPRVVIGAGEHPDIHVLWQEIVFSGGSHGGETFFARSTDGGRSFTAPLNLSNTPAGAGKGRLSPERWDNGSLDLIRTPDGDLVAAWTEYEGALRVSRSTDGGVSFGAPVLVAGHPPDLPARGPSLAMAPDGALHLAWDVGEDPRANIRIARSDDGGRSFGEPHVVLPSGGHADAPKVAVDAYGTVHLVFAESAAGPFRRSHLRYARSPAGRYAFEETRQLAELTTRGRDGAGFPHLALDGDGNPYLVWEVFPPEGRNPEGLAISLSRDGGRSFDAPSLVPGTREPGLGFNGSLQGLLMRKLAVDSAGGIAVVNSTFQPGERSRVRLMFGRAAGEG